MLDTNNFKVTTTSLILFKKLNTKLTNVITTSPILLKLLDTKLTNIITTIETCSIIRSSPLVSV